MTTVFEKIAQRVYEVDTESFVVDNSLMSVSRYYLPGDYTTKEKRLKHVVDSMLKNIDDYAFILKGSLEGRHDKNSSYFGASPVLYIKIVSLSPCEYRWLRANSRIGEHCEPDTCECGADVTYGRGSRHHSFWCRRYGK
jgi:hypothetical protein